MLITIYLQISNLYFFNTSTQSWSLLKHANEISSIITLHIYIYVSMVTMPFSFPSNLLYKVTAKRHEMSGMRQSKSTKSHSQQWAVYAAAN